MNCHFGDHAWQDANQRVLVAELALLRDTLRRRRREPGPDEAALPEEGARILQLALQDARAAMPAPTGLDRLCALFDLSPLERATLLLCAGIELDSTVASDCAAAHGDRRRPYPTFSLALAVLPEPHWSALAPDAPLRYWRLIELGAASTITTSPLRIDERILHFIAGVASLDERLSGYVEPVPSAEGLPPSHQALADRIATAWSDPESETSPPVVQICGRDEASKRQVAAAACTSLDLRLQTLSAGRLPQGVAELEMLQRLWEREAALGRLALLLDTSGSNGSDHDAVHRWMARSRTPLLLSTTEPLREILRPSIHVVVHKPTTHEQRRLWEEALRRARIPCGNGELDRLVSHFDLSAPAIGVACAGRSHVPSAGSVRSSSLDTRSLWEACRTGSRSKLDDLAERIESTVTWDDLVVPERTMAFLRDVGIHVRQRSRVYEMWGFAAKSARGLGISAMFCGASGTGKTLAAEVLANELQLDLYRIDLSGVVSKYIGETEKNLRRVFDAAEEGGAVLLFDEADALFGKRSEVKDSHDRYANIEVAYLLQRMEAYRGLSILTTNVEDAVDPAFLRRIRFVVQFPFPDAAARAEIWRRAFPDATPTDGIDTGRLSRLSVAGGGIRNMALHAAFMAAEDAQSVGMAHLRRAARSELAKLEKPWPAAELEAWR